MDQAVSLPEEQLLIAFGKPHANDRDLVLAKEAMSRPGFCWSEALRLSAAHWVQPMLAWNLKTQGAIWGCLPKMVRVELVKALFIAKMRRSLYHAALAPVLEEFQSKGVPLVLMKGAVVTETIYPPHSRLLNDLDVLVPIAYRSVAIDIFNRSGFRAVKEAPDPESYHELSLVKGSGAVFLCIDLHWDVYPKSRPFHFDMEEVYARAQSQTFGAHHVLGMSPEDTFVHYATQLFIDDFRHTFLRFCDLYGLAAAGLDQNRLVSIALATGAAGITHTALKVLGLLGTHLPSPLLENLAQSSLGCAIASEFLTDPRWLFGRRQIAYGAAKFIQPLYIDDPHERRRYRWLFPRVSYAWERECGHPAGTAFLHTIRGILSMLVCGGLLKVTAACPLAWNKCLRGLLWRQS